MPIYKDRDEDADGLLRTVLALRLGQIAADYPDQESFAAALGVSKGTLWALLRAKCNPTFQTVERMARSLKVQVVDLLGVNEAHLRASYGEFGFDYDQLSGQLERARKSRVSLNELTGHHKHVDRSGAPAHGADAPGGAGSARGGGEGATPRQRPRRVDPGKDA